MISLIIFDIAALLSSLLLAHLIRKEILLYVYPVFRMWTFPFSTYLVNHPYFLGLWVRVLVYERLYTKRFAVGEEIKRLWQASGKNELTFEDRLRLEECN